VAKPNPKETSAVDRKRAWSLLVPIAAFLHAGGMSNETALNVFSDALKKASGGSIGRRIVRIGNPTRYAEVVSVWLRDPAYLDEKGWPRALTLNGRLSFASLVKKVTLETDPTHVLSVLMRYGNVKRTKDGLYELIRPFFYSSGPKTMAYEPLAHFLSDASSTLSKILKRSSTWRGPDLFWQKAENPRLTEDAARRFALFAKERSLVFLHELDDWLEANSQKNRAKRCRLRRIGLGIFSIYSDPESFDSGR
jgi:hypothetical protein